MMSSGPYVELERERLAEGRGEKLTVIAGGRRLSWSEVLQRWCDDPRFRARFNHGLSEAPYAAFFWETPAVSAHTIDHHFECVVIDSPALAGTSPDAASFAGHLAGAEGPEVRRFANLGGDATLVVPCPYGDRAAYPHLAAFVRQAPADQRDALWRNVGQAVREWIDAENGPLWVSTSGLGVYWVHVRLDSRPKYYVHQPYRAASA